jgi:hypothetical protein
MGLALGVCAVLRNEAENLPALFQVLEDLERHSEIDQIVYSFYENDSVDHSASLLIDWLRGKTYSFISEVLGLPHWRSQERQRTQLLATARNAALRRLMQRPVDYVLILDVDLEFTASDCCRLVDVLQQHPSSAMVCASSIQPLKSIDTGSSWSYYDSWALIDRLDRPALSGLEIPFLDLKDRQRWIDGHPIVVNSAFGGLAVVRSTVIRRHTVAWNGDAGCEHWAFCAQVRQGGSVLVVPDVQPRVRTDSSVLGLHPEYINGVRDLLLQEGVNVAFDAMQ